MQALPATTAAREGQRPAGPAAWLLLTPMVLWLLAFVVVPTAILLVYSFSMRGQEAPVDFHFTWENYARVFSGTYLKILVRSICYAGLTTALCIVIGYPVAYFIGRAGERWRNRLLMLIMVPFWTSFLIRTYAWVNILADEGQLNSLLVWARLIEEPFSMLYTPGAVILGLTYSYLPFMILPIYGSVEKLDNSLVEAAFDLGAGPVRAFQSVVIPLTRPGIVAGTLLVFIPSLAMFAISELLGGGQVPLVGNVIQNQFLQARDWPFGAALGMTLMALFAIAFAFTSRRQPAQ